MDNFESMLKYCEEARCRHNYFAAYFGDEKMKSCGKRCDTCCNVKQVEKDAQAFKYSEIQRSQAIVSSLNVNGVDEDLYGGGRVGIKNDNDSYYDSGGENNLERKAKSALAAEIQKQFSLRNGRRKDGEEIISAAQLLEKQLVKTCRVKAADATSKKISGLTILQRETYLTTIVECLQFNYDAAESSSRNLTRNDILCCGIEFEYSLFSSNTVMAMYRRAMAFGVRRIFLCFCYIIIYFCCI